MLIENADYFVRLVDLPGSVGGAVNPNEDGTYNLYVNARFSTDRERIVDEFLHEWEHLENDDLYGDKEIAAVEDWPTPITPAPEKDSLPDVVMIGRSQRRDMTVDQKVMLKMLRIAFPGAFKEKQK